MKKILDKFKTLLKIYYKDIIFLIILSFLCFYKLPYVIYRPGSAINISSRISVDGVNNLGKYYMNSVTVSEGNIPSILLSFLMKDWDIVKKEEITFDNMDYETTFKVEQFEMQSTIDLAKLIACSMADCSANISSEQNFVAYIEPHANTNLKVLDEIISIDDVAYSSFDDLRKYITSKNIGDKISIKVIENNKEVEKYSYVYEYESSKIIGISVATKRNYETTPSIEVASSANEAGASGGLMLTLAIYDSLIEKDLTGGKKIMGTGTIDAYQNVGEIGGVKYKLLGAKNSGADVFFIPFENYEEAKKVYDDYHLSFDLVKVKTLDDAIMYLENIDNN